MCELLVDVLETLGVGTTTVTQNGEDAFRLFCKHKPDIVLTDWHMSPMNGMELTQKIRNETPYPEKMTPIIMMTGFSSPERISEARDSGTTEFLVKPFSVKDLSKRLTHIIKMPRDFIISENFSGPDRRRSKKNEDKDEKRGEHKGLIERITASYDLMTKIGMGNLDPSAIAKSQQIMDENRIDFVPLAQKYLEQLNKDILKIRTADTKTTHQLQDLSASVMQIKANARIFKYDRLGDLAGIMLNFIENLKEVDDEVMRIIEAHDQSLRILVNNEISGDGGDVGENFQQELESVCSRYAKTRAENQKRLLQKTIQG